MAKGGARARSGPPANPQALRRDRPSDVDGWVVLPADGREGDAPEWPLDGCSDREVVLWEREWRRPQALMWERNGQELEVALFVRAVVAAERPDASSPARTLVRQLQEALGLSVPGLLRNRWRIAEVEPVVGGRPVARRPVQRKNFRVVDGGA